MKFFSLLAKKCLEMKKAPLPPMGEYALKLLYLLANKIIENKRELCLKKPKGIVLGKPIINANQVLPYWGDPTIRQGG